MFFIGIDLSDKVLDSCIIDATADVVARSRFDFSDDGFRSFIQHIQEHEIGSQTCVIGLENPRSRIVDFLIQRGYTVLPVNPYSIAKYRESRAPSKAKSDPADTQYADAQYIADYIREHHKTLRVARIPDDLSVSDGDATSAEEQPSINWLAVVSAKASGPTNSLL